MAKAEKTKPGQQKVVTILVVLALVLGFALAKQKGLIGDTSNNQPEASANLQTKVAPVNSSADEQALLHPPSADASASAKESHAALVARLAKAAPFLEIKDCKPSTLVLQVKQGADLEIRNADSVKHSLIFDEENTIEIEANEKKMVKVDFKYGPGDYGYVCEGLGLVGFLHIIP